MEERGFDQVCRDCWYYSAGWQDMSGLTTQLDTNKRSYRNIVHLHSNCIRCGNCQRIERCNGEGQCSRSTPTIWEDCAHKADWGQSNGPVIDFSAPRPSIPTVARHGWCQNWNARHVQYVSWQKEVSVHRQAMQLNLGNENTRQHLLYRALFLAFRWS